MRGSAMPAEKAIIQKFRTFDKNNDGYISREELGTVLKKLDKSWTETRLDRLFKVLDLNGDGRLSYEEFVEWAYSPQVVHTKDIDAFRSTVARAPARPQGGAASNLRGSDGAAHAEPTQDHADVQAADAASASAQQQSDIATESVEEKIARLTVEAANLGDLKTSNAVSAKEEARQWISKRDVVELGAMRAVPEGITEVLYASALLLQYPVSDTPEWKSVRVMLQVPGDYINMMITVDVSTIPEENVKRVEELLKLPFFTAENMARKSLAASNIIKWVSRIVQAYKLQQIAALSEASGK
eukprot:TRINITY_DN2817_c0_g1_i1.p1 TRINITY_DN2817_c0_g1~~TRINITY_DN2817_c0_g1_i1.p1  ORF type:complete len:318 (+),score=57.42 TRINITY_DN2817_c0_g1_i1:60-956(+)